MNRVAPLLLSLSLFTTAGTCFAQEQDLPETQTQIQTPGNNLQEAESNLDPDPESAEGSVSDERFENSEEIQPTAAEADPFSALEERFIELENAQRVANAGLLGIPYPLLLAGGSTLIGLIGLLLAITAFIRVVKQRSAVEQLDRRTQSLLTRLGGLEVQLEQERILNQTRATQAEQTATVTRPSPTPTKTPTPEPSRPIVSKAAAQSAPVTPVPVAFSKSGLISALNGGDRQQLREAATAELNITSDSENAIATGRSISTELEVVPGGGSYWLVMLQGQAWLFPTERTLKGFAAAQPSKGLFHYEQQTIAKPQLLEPAALEGSGERWSVKSMGLIGTP
jgi:hypothetical protein